VSEPPPDRVEFAPAASRDLAAVLDHLGERSPSAAAAWASALADALELLASYAPRLDGAPVRLLGGAEVRRWPVLPVVLFYQRLPGVLRVARLHHHAREPITR
jgi:plasmid stabilization system protein ParE